jgi:hypothetical protein
VAGLVIGVDTFFNSRNERISALALRGGIAAVSPYREFVDAGGLMSYGGSIADAPRTRTARALGLAVPLILQAQSDEVIE